MSNNYGMGCATYNISLKTESDIFRTSCAHLYHFLHSNSNNGKSAECKPTTFKMHLEFNDSPLTEAKERYTTIEQLKAKIKTLEDALQAKDDVIEKLENKNIVDKTNNNTIDDESINSLVTYSGNIALQLNAKLKILEDSLQTNVLDVVNKLMSRMEKLERDFSDNVVDNAAGVSNNTTQDNPIEKCQQPPSNSCNSNKETCDGNNLSDEEYNNNKYDASVSKEHHITTKEKQEFEFDKDKWILISNFKSSDSSDVTAIINVTWLAINMGLTPLTRDQIVYIDVFKQNQEYVAYFVTFRSKNIKDAFLKERHILKEFEETRFIRIIDESERNGVLIRNFKSSNWSKESAILNVIAIAKKMGLSLTRDQVKRIDVDGINENVLYFLVYFCNKQMEDAFLENKHILQEFPETKALKIIPFF